jgi:hypothetical protein
VDSGDLSFKPKVMVFKINTDNSITLWERFLNPIATSDPFDPTKIDAWGAAWNFRNEIFFSHNGGQGVWQLNMNEFDVSDPTVNISVQHTGSSVPTFTNDGLNCMEASIPFTTCATGGAASGPVTSAQCDAVVSGGFVRSGSGDSTCEVLPGQPCDIEGADFSRCCMTPPPTPPPTTAPPTTAQPTPAPSTTTSTPALRLQLDSGSGSVDYDAGDTSSAGASSSYKRGKSMGKHHHHHHHGTSGSTGKHGKSHTGKTGHGSSMMGMDVASGVSVSLGGVVFVAGAAFVAFRAIRRHTGSVAANVNEVGEESPLIDVYAVPPSKSGAEPTL